MCQKYKEYAWYNFGLKVGLSNLYRSGLSLGLKKTLGKIFQPINSYTRFPEYYFFEASIINFLNKDHNKKPVILDIGSPKLFGIYVAYHYDVIVHLTDISRLNIDEYVLLWEAIRPHAKGRAIFSQQDARSILEPNDKFDIVFSMSVIEHIEKEIVDPKAISEFLRVLKPAGLLLLSVPFGPKSVEQFTSNFTYDAVKKCSENPIFFQRIFDRSGIHEHILLRLESYVDEMEVRTIYRSARAIFYAQFRAIAGENVSGFFGFLNPLLSMIFNRHEDGISDRFYSAYEELRSNEDIYGDLVFSCYKRLP